MQHQSDWTEAPNKLLYYFFPCSTSQYLDLRSCFALQDYSFCHSLFFLLLYFSIHASIHFQPPLSVVAGVFMPCLGARSDLHRGQVQCWPAHPRAKRDGDFGVATQSYQCVSGTWKETSAHGANATQNPAAFMQQYKPLHHHAALLYKTS